MGDKISNFDVFKSLGFDSRTQWIFYEGNFENFFSFFAANIDEENILEDREVLEYAYVENQFNTHVWHTKLNQLDSKYPSLREYNNQQEAALIQEIKMIEQAENDFTILVDEMRTTKIKLNTYLSELEDNYGDLLKSEQDLLTTCRSKSKHLEELQQENCKLCSASKMSFTQYNSPPLFIHQLRLDQYFLKCDSFMEYFKLYMMENFKIKENMNLNITSTESRKLTANLKNLEKTIEHYTFELFKEKTKTAATKSLIEHLDLSNIYAINLSDMERETHELERFNEHHLTCTNEALLNNIKMHIKQHARQRIEMILYENTKQKLRRAIKLHENVKQLITIIYQALSNAELVWMAIQMDLEKRRKRFDKTEQLAADASVSLRRIKTMEQRLAAPDIDDWSLSTFTEKTTELLSKHLGQQIRNDSKVCLYEYEKFGRLVAYALQRVLRKQPLITTINQFDELSRIENILKPLVYDSPVKNPLLDNLHFLQQIFNAKAKRQQIEAALRIWRTQYKDNIIERMDKDKLWRYSQLLWIWFLTDPKRILLSIEEARKTAAHVSSNKSFVGGIKRN